MSFLPGAPAELIYGNVQALIDRTQALAQDIREKKAAEEQAQFDETVQSALADLESQPPPGTVEIAGKPVSREILYLTGAFAGLVIIASLTGRKKR